MVCSFYLKIYADRDLIQMSKMLMHPTTK